jgi:hypothetical protein
MALADCALRFAFVKLGTAIINIMVRIAIITTSSIRVKPDSLVLFIFYPSC